MRSPVGISGLQAGEDVNRPYPLRAATPSRFMRLDTVTNDYNMFAQRAGERPNSSQREAGEWPRPAAMSERLRRMPLEAQ